MTRLIVSWGLLNLWKSVFRRRLLVMLKNSAPYSCTCFVLNSSGMSPKHVWPKLRATDPGIHGINSDPGVEKHSTQVSPGWETRHPIHQNVWWKVATWPLLRAGQEKCKIILLIHIYFRPWRACTRFSTNKFLPTTCQSTRAIPTMGHSWHLWWSEWMAPTFDQINIFCLVFAFTAALSSVNLCNQP